MAKPKPRHTVEVPDSLWAWFQQRSGKTVPGNDIRDALYEYRINHPDDPMVYTGPMDNTITALQEIPKPIPYRLRALGLLTDPVDFIYTKALEAWVTAHDGDLDAALTWFEKAVAERGLKNPRAWLVDWHKNRDESNDSATVAVPG